MKAPRVATRTPTTKEHPAIASAKRAIRRSLSGLTPKQVFGVAAMVETLQHGEDRGRWGLSASYATDQPAHRWTCDAPGVTKGAAK